MTNLPFVLSRQSQAHSADVSQNIPDQEVNVQVKAVVTKGDLLLSGSRDSSVFSHDPLDQILQQNHFVNALAVMRGILLFTFASLERDRYSDFGWQ